MRLQGKVAIVTGAATGIGEAIAACLAREGAAVVIDYIEGQHQVAEQAVQALTDGGAKAMAVQADVTDEAQVDNLIAQAVRQYGRLDIMVNNAGIEKQMPFVDTTLEVWNRELSVNLTGPFLGMRAAARPMIKQGDGGRLINISSVHEDLPMPTNGPYCATKGGLRMLMRTAAVELGPHGITVNNIGPGATDTPLDAGLKADTQRFNDLLSHIPMGRMAQPPEIGNLAVWLASDEAAYITGSTYFIDGGLMRWATPY